MRQKFIPLEHEVMKHLFKCSASLACSRILERDKRSSPGLGDRIGIRQAAIGFVSRDLSDGEVLSSRFDHRGKRQRIVRVHLLNVDSGYDVGFNSTHEMALHPILLDVLFAILNIMPAGKPRGCKAGRIDSETGFKGLA